MLQWTSALAIGVPEIDAQHQELFRRVDRLAEQLAAEDRAGTQRTLAFLREYVVVHFAAEERLMEETAYAGLAVHVEEHRRFTGVVRTIDRQLRDGAPVGPILQRLEREVAAWLRDHVATIDRALGRHLAARPPPRIARLA